MNDPDPFLILLFQLLKDVHVPGIENERFLADGIRTHAQSGPDVCIVEIVWGTDRQIVNGIDYLTVCSPNYLHDAHIRTALLAGSDAICEKQLVLNPWNLDILQELEAE